jgi:hypothetical protein
MAKKRTKKQKARSVYHYAYPAGRSFTAVDPMNLPQAKTGESRKTDVSGLYQYDPHYLRMDLAKTVAVTLLMVAVEIGLYYWL